MSSVGEATRALRRIEDGDARAADELFQLVYGELRRLAACYLESERPDHTLQPTALVHEAYLKMVDQTSVTRRGRAHFFSIAALQMRRILVDHARSKGRIKRGNGRAQKPLSEHDAIISERELDLVALDEALERLEQFNPEGARVVTLRFFGGLSIAEIADVLGVSGRTVDRKWDLARRWLWVQLAEEEKTGGAG